MMVIDIFKKIEKRFLQARFTYLDFRLKTQNHFQNLFQVYLRLLSQAQTTPGWSTSLDIKFLPLDLKLKNK